ncbi:hypothetical protein Salat_1115500 [Sesamum alatum]|uniref:Reverse transcriptase zinc-binding domain-containing protein n=1 Tax=Sesamum alatum TaxID=300844 RepID=A0AAE2CT50_9LAMI|nr:hypothetical protein Salat_1115500 [Sesamum alatum]
MLRNKSVWTSGLASGTWSWKIVRLRTYLLHMLDYRVGDGCRFSLWHDLWFLGGASSQQFPKAPLTGLSFTTKLSVVIIQGAWEWLGHSGRALVEVMTILEGHPHIEGCEDRIFWKSNTVKFVTAEAYKLFTPQVPKVYWSGLLQDKFMIAWDKFILWLAIQGNLSTMDKA